MKALELIIFTVTLLVAVTAVLGWKDGQKELDRYKEMDQRDWMCSEYVKNATLLNGFYNRDARYYCVWTGGRTEADINRTVFHEETHHLIGNDPVHFCKRYWKVLESE